LDSNGIEKPLWDNTFSIRRTEVSLSRGNGSMAFKRSAVRSRLSPQKALISSEIKAFSCFYRL